MSIWDVIGVNLVPVADIVSAVFLGSYSNPNPNLGSHQGSIPQGGDYLQFVSGTRFVHGGFQIGIGREGYFFVVVLVGDNLSLTYSEEVVIDSTLRASFANCRACFQGRGLRRSPHQ